MILTNELRGIIVSRGLSQADVAKELGVTPGTFYRKMKNGIFSNLEIAAMMKLLNIDNPMRIFFAGDVAQ